MKLFRKFKSTAEGIRRGLAKTHERLAGGLGRVLSLRRQIDEELCEELEELMIEADMGVQTTTEIIDDIRQAYRDGEIADTGELKSYLKRELKQLLGEADVAIRMADEPPTVILVAGVNGSGKTTSIAKLAKHFRDDGKKVLLAASDTFRAAAVEQLDIWSRRIGVDIVKHQTGADPGAVTYDALDAAVARGSEVLIVDTAGRLHTKKNLMEELGKIRRVIRKRLPTAPHEVILVLDATTGQNAIQQAKLFDEAIDVTGLFLAKLDGTAKGGIVVAIKKQIDIPVKFIGVGEQPEDIEPFDPDKFVEALIG
ncbi:MAG: signal recognition particle-docking protein FtsY [Planctomycetota bacterium]